MNGEVDEAVSDMGDFYAADLEDEWRNWRLDHPELESDETTEDGVIGGNVWRGMECLRNLLMIAG